MGILLSYFVFVEAARQATSTVFNEARIYMIPNSFKIMRMTTMTSKT